MSDPQIEDPLLALIAENPPKDALELRETLDGFMAPMNENLPVIGESIDDVVVSEFPHQNLTVDIHRPSGEGPFPVLVYLHGGGWILGSPKTHRRLGFRFVEQGFVVFNVHYRLAPEHPFPAAFDDCVSALRWVIANAAEYGGDPSRLAMGGDSAGGNLTAAVAASLAQAGEQLLKAILLIYPALDFATMNGPETMADGGPDLMGMMVGSYIGHDREALIQDTRVSPIHVAEHLPPTHILCGTADTLLEDCKVLGQRLSAAGIDHESVIYEGMPHGFVQLEEFFPEARQSIERMAAFLRERV